VLSVESVGLPSVMMWGDYGEVRCCGLSKDWNGGEVATFTVCGLSCLNMLRIMS
jgi:hypothetical protein